MYGKQTDASICKIVYYSHSTSFPHCHTVCGGFEVLLQGPTNMYSSNGSRATKRHRRKRIKIVRASSEIFAHGWSVGRSVCVVPSVGPHHHPYKYTHFHTNTSTRKTGRRGHTVGLRKKRKEKFLNLFLPMRIRELAALWRSFARVMDILTSVVHNL